MLINLWDSYLLLVLDLVSFTDEAFFVLLAHMCIELVVSEEAFPAELAEWMYAAFDLLVLFGMAMPMSSCH